MELNPHPEQQALLDLINTCEVPNIELAFQVMASTNTELNLSEYDSLYQQLCSLEIIAKTTSKRVMLISLLTIKYLDLVARNLTQLPKHIELLGQLEVINAANNKINKLPATLGNMSNIKELLLSDNNLSQIPANIVHLHQLERLNLADNLFTEIPQEVYHLPKLKQLIVTNNLFKTTEEEKDKLQEQYPKCYFFF